MIYHAIKIRKLRAVKCGHRTMIKGTGLSSLDRRLATEDARRLAPTTQARGCTPYNATTPGGSGGSRCPRLPTPPVLTVQEDGRDESRSASVAAMRRRKSVSTPSQVEDLTMHSH
jgi:hypothetical protein